ncbi:hypothetical protein [Neisseria weixii]|uniref:hypothetical protein n=1 Tax=Neisseria weixii TaxID=1853276 RepID=UPI0035A0B33B
MKKTATAYSDGYAKLTTATGNFKLTSAQQYEADEWENQANRQILHKATEN